jgi:4-carboxymuconolactone decarboxylase
MPGTSDFGTFGRYTELSLDEMTADQKRVYEFTVKQRGEVPGPYKIWLQNPKLIEVMVPLGAYYQGHSSLSKAEIEIATNLTNAKWLGASGRSPTKRLWIVKRRARVHGRRLSLQLR